jgi:phytoene/squalene synthetase
MARGYSSFQRFTVRQTCLPPQETAMTTLIDTLNPFSLMMEPERVLQTMERSQQLRGLRRHKLRPLDKPLIPYTSEALASRAAFDAMIDAQDMDDEGSGCLN